MLKVRVLETLRSQAELLLLAAAVSAILYLLFAEAKYFQHLAAPFPKCVTIGFLIPPVSELLFFIAYLHPEVTSICFLRDLYPEISCWNLFVWLLGTIAWPLITFQFRPELTNYVFIASLFVHTIIRHSQSRIQQQWLNPAIKRSLNFILVRSVFIAFIVTGVALIIAGLVQICFAPGAWKYMISVASVVILPAGQAILTWQVRSRVAIIGRGSLVIHVCLAASQSFLLPIVKLLRITDVQNAIEVQWALTFLSFIPLKLVPRLVSLWLTIRARTRKTHSEYTAVHELEIPKFASNEDTEKVASPSLETDLQVHALDLEAQVGDAALEKKQTSSVKMTDAAQNEPRKMSRVAFSNVEPESILIEPSSQTNRRSKTGIILKTSKFSGSETFNAPSKFAVQESSSASQASLTVYPSNGDIRSLNASNASLSVAYTSKLPTRKSTLRNQVHIHDDDEISLATPNYSKSVNSLNPSLSSLPRFETSAKTASASILSKSMVQYGSFTSKRAQSEIMHSASEQQSSNSDFSIIISSDTSITTLNIDAPRTSTHRRKHHQRAQSAIDWKHSASNTVIRNPTLQHLKREVTTSKTRKRSKTDPVMPFNRDNGSDSASSSASNVLLNIKQTQAELLERAASFVEEANAAKTAASRLVEEDERKWNQMIRCDDAFRDYMATMIAGLIALIYRNEFLAHSAQMLTDWEIWLRIIGLLLFGFGYELLLVVVECWWGAMEPYKARETLNGNVVTGIVAVHMLDVVACLMGADTLYV
ncbi:hypothetical protein HDU77_001198 [Chytriomyces hyalinus]|nr:hypothetical protein HDU77_001198 [Chytriomyces hyalinus]